MKLVLPIITSLLFVFLFFTPVKAQNINVNAEIFATVFFNEDNAILEQRIILHNNSSQNVLNSIELSLPKGFNPSSVQFKNSNVRFVLNNNKYSIDLSANPLKLNEKATLLIQYKTNKIVDRNENYIEILWPEFNFNFNIIKNHTDFYFPFDYGNLLYSSRTIENKDALEGSQVFSLEDSKGILLTFGTEKAKEFKMNWYLNNSSDLNQDFYVKFPDTSLVDFTLKKIVGATKGYINDKGDKYFSVDLNPFESKEGEVSAVIKKINNINLPTNIDLAADLIGSELLREIENLDQKSAYELVKNKLEPARSYELDNELDLNSILTKQQHSPADYANLLTIIYREIGLPAYTVLGILKPPGANNYIWHTWNAVFVENQWIYQDIYLEDSLNINQFESVSIQRTPWIVLNDSIKKEGVLAFNTDELMFFDESTLNEEEKLDFSAFLNLDGKAYSGAVIPWNLQITNTGNVPITLEEVLVNKEIIDKNVFRNIILFPGNQYAYPVTGVIVHDPFYSGVKEVNIDVTVASDNSKVSKSLTENINIEVNYVSLLVKLVASLSFSMIMVVLIRVFYFSSKEN